MFDPGEGNSENESVVSIIYILNQQPDFFRSGCWFLLGNGLRFGFDSFFFKFFFEGFNVLM